LACATVSFVGDVTPTPGAGTTTPVAEITTPTPQPGSGEWRRAVVGTQCF